MVKRIEKIRDKIRDKINVIKSFRKTDRYNSINLVLHTSNPIDKKTRYLSTECISREWDYYTRQDIMDRLHLLINRYYTIDELKFINIDLKLLSVLNSYSCSDLEIYYNNVIKKIEITLKEWITVCKIYIDIEINYLECCKAIISNENTKIQLDNFTINII